MPCRWSSSTRSCCTWSQSWPRPQVEVGHHTQESEVIKVKVEAEVTTFWRISNLGDALDKSHSIQSIKRPPPAGFWTAK